jgi:hypothetical protein
MIDPDCKVCLGIGWVCENHPNRAWTEDLDVSAEPECPARVFAPTASKSLTLVRCSKKVRQHQISVALSSKS